MREQEGVEHVLQEGAVQLDDGNKHGTVGYPVVNSDGIILENEAFWDEVRKALTEVGPLLCHRNLARKEIMEIENVSAEAVKGWARQVRGKLKSEHIREKLYELM